MGDNDHAFGQAYRDAFRQQTRAQLAELLGPTGEKLARCHGQDFVDTMIRDLCDELDEYSERNWRRQRD